MKIRTTALMVGVAVAMLTAVVAQESAQPTQPTRRRSAPAIETAPQANGPQLRLDVVLVDQRSAAGDRGSLPSAKDLLALEKEDKLDRVRRVLLSTIGGGKTVVQFGERVPVVVGRNVGGFGGRGASDGRPTAFSYQYESIGTLISAETRVEDEGTVIVQLQVEESRLVSTKSAADDASDPIAAQKTVTLTSQSTLRLKPGVPTLAQASRSTAEADVAGQFIIVTANVDGPAPERPATE
jgi:hypothetical protein